MCYNVKLFLLLCIEWQCGVFTRVVSECCLCKSGDPSWGVLPPLYGHLSLPRKRISVWLHLRFAFVPLLIVLLPGQSVKSDVRSSTLLQVHPSFILPLIRMKWWTARRDLVLSSAHIRSLQTPAARSVTPVCMRGLSTPTATPSPHLPTPATSAPVPEEQSPACPLSAHKRLVSSRLPSQDSAVPSVQVLVDFSLI